MVEKIQRKVRITTRHRVLEDEPKIDDIFPMREWRISVHIVGTDGKLYPATVFDRVTYQLHETFTNPRRVLTEPPFELVEKGWGEFEMKVTFRIANGGGDQTVPYELQFREPESFQEFSIAFPTNKKELLAKLAESGPVPQPAASTAAASGAANGGGSTNAHAGGTHSGSGAQMGGSAQTGAGEKRAGDSIEGESKPKKPRVAIKGSVDLERLSVGLEQLGEQDVLSIVQMISDNKTPDVYVKNDADAGEFHVDLFTLPNGLLKSMWDFVAKKVNV